MEVTYYLFCFLMMLMYSGMDGVQTGPVLMLPQPLGAIKNGGIGRPLMRNDQQPNGIYLKSDQRRPLVTLRTRYYPRPPHRRLQQQQQQQQLKQQGFIIRNSNGRHPPRPAPVSISNHLGAFAGGNNNPGTFHHAKRQQQQQQQHQPLKQHLNHQFQTVNMPTNIPHPHNKQPTSNHQRQNGPIGLVRQPDPATIPPDVKSPGKESDPSKSMSDDGQNFLKMELDGNDYLTYLYLGMNETRLAGGEEHPMASANAGVQMTHPPSKGDDDIIIGSPTTIHFDPYVPRNQSFRSKSSDDRQFPQVNGAGDHDRQSQTMTANIIKSLDEDWLPIASPWEKYGNKSESKLQ